MNRLGFIMACVSGATVAAVAPVMTVAIPGCKTVPGADAVRVVARLCGSATGLVLADCVTDPQAADAIVSLVRRLDEVTPNDGETVRDAWLRVARLHTDILITRKSITPEVGAAVMAGFGLIVKGYDLMVARYPEVASCAELTAAAIDGFADGLVSNYGRDRDGGSPADPEVLGALIATREYKMLVPTPL